MSVDPNYSPDQTWWEKIFGPIASWLGSIPNQYKIAIGIGLIVLSIALAFTFCGQVVVDFTKSALIQLALGIGVTGVGWAIFGDGNTSTLYDALSDAVFFIGISLFAQSAVCVIKYSYRVGQISEYSPEFIEWLNKGEANNTVYKGIDFDHKEVYTGITRQPLHKRLYQHNRLGKGFKRLDPIGQGLTRNQARAIETYKILTDGTSQVNKILSISKQHRFFDEAMKWAKIFLGG